MRLIAACAQRGDDVAGGGGVRLARHHVDQHEVHGDSVRHEAREGDARRAVGAAAGVCSDDAVGDQDLAVELEVLLQRDLHHAVYSTTVGERPHPLHDVLLLAVDHQVRARGGGHLRLLRAAHGRHHPGARPPRELDRGVADGACAARHQHRLPLDRAVGEEATVRRHRRNPERGAGCPVDAGRERHRLLGWHHDQLGGGPERTPPLRLVDPHALANTCGWDARPDPFDHAGAVLVRDDARKGHAEVAVPAAPGLGVGGVHRRGADPNPDLARARLRVGQGANLQHVTRRTLAIVEGGSHAQGDTARGCIAPHPLAGPAAPGRRDPPGQGARCAGFGFGPATRRRTFLST